jgi:malate dehydrogenase
MSTVAIIGAGDVGGATAHALASRDCVSRLVLVDSAAGVASGKALDIIQSGAVDGFHTRLEGTDDLGRAIGCAVCVVADRAGQKSLEWQGEEGLAMLTRLTGWVGEAPIVFAGAGQLNLIAYGSAEARLPRARLIGSSVEAFVSSVAAIVAIEAECSADEVALTALGVPPRGFVVPWSEATIGGYGLERVLPQVQLARIEARIARLWPPGPYALGAAAARVTESILEASRRSVTVFTPLDGEFGVQNRVAAVPVVLDAGGVARIRVPGLSPRERVQLETALGA